MHVLSRFLPGLCCMRLKVGSRKPVLALLLLAPTIPELLTGSTPITMLLLSPLKFLLQMVYIVSLYGSGALLIREATIRWNKGWGTTLLLGAAYGIMEEGIAVHTFFEPYGNPVGIFGTYGRAFGVNWVWAVGLTIFHSIYSISLPILLAGLLFPEVSRKQWLDRGLIGIAMAVYLGFILMFYSFAPYKPDTFNLMLFLGIVVLFVVTAYLVPKDILKPSTGTPKGKAVVLSISAALFFASWVVVGLAAPQNSIPPVVSIVFIIAVSLISARLILSRVGDHENEMSKLAVVTGLMSALFLWDILMEFTAVPGILFVTGAFIYFLWRLRNSLALRSVVTRSIDLQVL